MSWQQKKLLIEQRAQLLADMKAILKKSEEEKRDLTAEESGTFGELNTKAEQRKLDIERYEQMQQIEVDLAKQGKGEQRAGRDDLNTPEQTAATKATEQRAAFDKALRFGRENLPENEQRSLSVSGIGVVGDRPFYDSLVLGMKAFAGVRQCGATILPTETGNPFTIPTWNDTSNSGTLVGESVSDTTEADPVTGTITLNGYKFSSGWITLSIELVQDASYPIEAQILTMASERIGRALNTYTTTGSGSNQPKGFVTAGTVGKTTALTNAFAYEELIDWVHSLDPAYRNLAGKVFIQVHDTTLASIRKLKDGNGRYIWSPGESGEPSRILDYPYVINNDLGQVGGGAGTVIGAIGAWDRYFVRDVTAPYIVRASEKFIDTGCIGFKVFSRHDGNLADTSAVKLLKLAAS